MDSSERDRTIIAMLLGAPEQVSNNAVFLKTGIIFNVCNRILHSLSCFRWTFPHCDLSVASERSNEFAVSHPAG